MTTKYLPRFVFSVMQADGTPIHSPVVHAIDRPVGEQELCLCGAVKDEMKNRRYRTYIEDLPVASQLCPVCVELIKKRIGEIYHIPEWEGIEI